MKNNAEKYNEIMKEIQNNSNNYSKYKDTLKSLEESTNILEERLKHLSSSNIPTVIKPLQSSLPIINSENESLLSYDNIIKDYHNIKLKLNSCNEDDDEEKEQYQNQLKELENEINKMNVNNSVEEEISSEELFKDLIINATNQYHLGDYFIL